jgi:hypothetical protein
VQFPNESITKLLIDAILSLTSVIANACDHHDNDNLRSVDEDTDHHAETSQDRRQLKEIPKKFVMDGIEFPSQEAFIKSGARCGTKDLTEEEREKEKNDIAEYRAKNPNVSRSIENITIDVVFNVIYSIFFGGRLSQGDIEAQMDVLNEAFASSGFSFNLREVQYYRKLSWFTSCANNQSFKESIRRGSTDGRDVLYIYTCNPTGGILGYAYLPSVIGDGVPLERDGVVLRYSSLPGGSSAPYNEGVTATHEVGHWLGLYHTFSVSKMRY